MKKEYEIPTIEIVEIKVDDVIVTSNLGSGIAGDNDFGGFWS